MFKQIQFSNSRPTYLQIKEYIQNLIVSGSLQSGERLPATRELGALLKVSRNTVIQAYQYLEDDGFIKTIKGKGAYVAAVAVDKEDLTYSFDWSSLLNDSAQAAKQLDVEKNELRWEKGMISFKSIAPDPDLFEVESFKRSFLNRFALEGAKLLNYGYAKGYQNLLRYLKEYIKNKGVNLSGKDILITNGFTEGLYLILTALMSPGDRIICENPTHNTALKIMKVAGLEVVGVPMLDDGIDLEVLEAKLATSGIKMGYLIPSYHNPTGLVMSPEKRLKVLKLFETYRVPVLEDGFNEELRYSGAHLAPLLAHAGSGNGVIYLGSFSKILFPGLRIGWIIADQQLIASLESVKRSINIHTSFLDQAILFEYLSSGEFDKYLKKARRVYRERYQSAVALVNQYLPCKKVWGEGGLHLFIELEEHLDARQILAECYRRGVLFMPGDIFYTDNSGKNTFRLGIARVSREEMERGLRIIGEVIEQQSKLK